MQVLYAPWRSEYFSKKQVGCVFCDIAANAKDDEENGVLYRAKHCYAVMNLYPYTPGHFMVIPYVHCDSIEALEEACWGEMSRIVRFGVKILKESLNAQGVNIGMNLGQAAGAGIAAHAHYHLVPRWAGDTNFITTIGQARVSGADFKEIYLKLKKAFGEYRP